MKLSKKIIAVVLSVLFVVAAFAGCSSNSGSKDDTKKTDIKIGVIEIGDDTESYTKAHSDGIKKACDELGISQDNITFKTKVEESNDCYTAAEELVAAGCNVVISNSYGHQDFIVKAAEENKDVAFVCMTGDFAAICGVDNIYNAFTSVYQARYVSGVVAGLKVQELDQQKKLTKKNYDNDGNVKIGYVGAYPYAEVKSGYTAFFLGLQSVFPTVSMQVQYTNSWFDIDKESEAAKTLMNDGCVIIGQHADSTGSPTAVQSAVEAGTVAYSVGYNVDMTDVAPDAALTSPTSDWSVYYKELFTDVMEGKEIPKDWAKGYDDNAVLITKLGKSCAEGTQDKVAAVEADLKAGKVQVFDTSKFTVDGKKITTNPIDLSYFDFSSGKPVVKYQGETKESIVKDDATGISYFEESTLRSAPYFTLLIDGITENNAN